jgi:hypothetical protein
MPVLSPVEGRNRPSKRPGLPAPPCEERPPLPEFVPRGAQLSPSGALRRFYFSAGAGLSP